MVRFRLRFEGREIPLSPTAPLVVGRDGACDLALDDPRVSRRHVAFRVLPTGVEVRDLGSTTGVLVNELAMREPCVVGHRDRVKIGGVAFLVLDAEGEHHSRTETRAATPARAPTPTATRPVGRAAATGELIDALAEAMEHRELDLAAKVASRLIARPTTTGERLGDDSLQRLSELLLVLAEQRRDATCFAGILQLHAAEGLVVSSALVDAIQAAAPRLPAIAHDAVDRYVAALDARDRRLSILERVRLRRVTTAVRRTGKAGAS